MSIWCTHVPIGQGHRHDDYEERAPGTVLSYATGFSNHYPNPADGPERPAAVGLATIPPWCVPGHADRGDEDTTGGWVRLEVASWAHGWHSGGRTVTGEEHAMVVLDPEAARQLGRALLDWADSNHLTPITETSHA